MSNKKAAPTVIEVIDSLRNEIEDYMQVFPEDAASLQPILKRLDHGVSVYDRRNFAGHITGSGIVLSLDRQKVLLIHHNVLSRWQQPGGHAEATDSTPLETAMRETREETGVIIQRTLPVCGKQIPIQIDVCVVPANPAKDEPEHSHYDFRYLFEVSNEAFETQQDEVSAAAWIPLSDPRVRNIAEAVQRMRSLEITT